MDGIEIRILREGDGTLLARIAPGVFDKSVDPMLLAEFLRDPRHHLALAIDDGLVVGMVSAVDYVNPDKPRELQINEVGAAKTHHQRGLASALLQAMFDEGRARGCWQAWVLTNRSNAPAMKLYARAGGQLDADDTAMFTFDLRR
jgi:aminoglycoside 6'-N-acetyltransferase I